MCSASALILHEASPDLERLLEAARAVPRDPRPEASQAMVGDEVVALRHICDLLELRVATRAAAMKASGAHLAAGNVSMVDWMMESAHVSGHAAAAAVCIGEQLPRIPATLEAVESAQLGTAHLAVMARTSAALEELDAPFHEAPLLARALELSVQRFQRTCLHVRHSASARAFLEGHREEVDCRRLTLSQVDGGMVALEGLLDAVAGATLRAALDPLARRDGAGDPRDHRRRMADALVELAGHGLNAGVVPRVAGQRPHLQVTASLETLLGIPGAPGGEIEFAPPIPGATVQRFACDAAVTRVIFGPGSAAVDVGRTRRVASGATRTALVARDKGCTWPRCTRPAAWSEAHHVVHWAQGGTTDLDNLVLLCGRHHWMVHEGGWRLVRHARTNVLLTLPPIPVRGVTGPPPPGQGPSQSGWNRARIAGLAAGLRKWRATLPARLSPVAVASPP